MIEVIYYVAASLDGYIATSDGAVDWLSAYNSGNEDYGFAAFYESVDAISFRFSWGPLEPTRGTPEPRSVGMTDTMYRSLPC
jgi:dihydrofolate reductase